MTELTTSGNAIAKLMLQDLSTKLPGAHVGWSSILPSVEHFADTHTQDSLTLMVSFPT